MSSPQLRCNQAAAFHRANQGAERKVAWVVVLTVVTMMVEILAGWQFHSMALLADGWHMSTHALAMGIALLAYRLARRFSGDARFAFGTWKIEILGAYTSALLLAVVALSMFWESFWRLLDPGQINYRDSMLVAVLGLGVNLLSAWLLGDDHHHGPGHHHDHGHAHDHDHDHQHDAHGHEGKGEKVRDLNKHAAYIHVLTDAATSVLAILALAGGMLWGAAWLDPMMGFVGGALILIWAWRLLKETGQILIDLQGGQLSHQIQHAAEDLTLELAELHVWRIGEGRDAAIIGLAQDDAAAIARLRQALQRLPSLAHLTIDHPAH